jgi:L-seryl-tRNA(Ser) seleniumtransferase
MALTRLNSQRPRRRDATRRSKAEACALIQTTKTVGEALKKRLGARIHETPTTAQLLGDDVLEEAMQRGGVTRAPIVPYEATAALCMLLLQNHKMLTMQFVGLPPGGGDILFKFIPPETLARLGGADAFARAVDESLSTLGALLKDPTKVRELLLGDVTPVT